MNLTEKTIKQQYLYKGRVVALRYDEVELPNNEKAYREVIEHPGGVGIIPYTDEQEIILVRQYRYPYAELTLEIPAGKRDPGEQPFTTGVRELREETGLIAKNMLSMDCLYPTPGYCGEIIWLFVATGLTQAQTDLDDDEFLEIERVPFKMALDWVMDGTIKDSKTQIAILKLNEWIRSGKLPK